MNKDAPINKGKPCGPMLSPADIARLEKAVERAIRDGFAKANRRELPRARWGVRLLAGTALAATLGVVAWKAGTMEARVEGIAREQAELVERVDKMGEEVDALAGVFDEIKVRIADVAQEMGLAERNEGAEQEPLIRCPEGRECK
mgnify:CR=1 FL=1